MRRTVLTVLILMGLATVAGAVERNTPIYSFRYYDSGDGKKTTGVDWNLGWIWNVQRMDSLISSLNASANNRLYSSTIQDYYTKAQSNSNYISSAHVPRNFTLLMDSCPVISATGGAAYVLTTSQAYNFTYPQVTAALGDTYVTSFQIKGGIYSLKLVGLKSSDCGIISIYIDGTFKSTLDLYSDMPVYNYRAVFFPITINPRSPNYFYHSLKLKVTGKNAGSSGYKVRLTLISIY